MSKTTPVSEIMTSRIRTVDVSKSLSAVRDLVSAEKFHHVPILDGTELVGIISSRDLVQVYRHRDSDEPSIADTMSTDLTTIRVDDKVERAINELADGDIHSILVLDAEERLVGIVTNIDLLDYLFE